MHGNEGALAGGKATRATHVSQKGAQDLCQMGALVRKGYQAPTKALLAHGHPHLDTPSPLPPCPEVPLQRPPRRRLQALLSQEQ